MKRRALNHSRQSNECSETTNRNEVFLPSSAKFNLANHRRLSFFLSFPFFEQSERGSDSHQRMNESLPTTCSMISNQKYQPHEPQYPNSSNSSSSSCDFVPVSHCITCPTMVDLKESFSFLLLSKTFYPNE